jgi:hypothetical protein
MFLSSIILLMTSLIQALKMHSLKSPKKKDFNSLRVTSKVKQRNVPNR